MEIRRYEEIPDYDRRMAIQELESGAVDRVVRALLSLAHTDPDRPWVESLCSHYAESTDWNIRGIAVLCFGHLARVHRKLDTETAVPIVIRALDDPSDFVRGQADTALSDILMFGRPQPYERDTAVGNLRSGPIDKVLLGLFAIAKDDPDGKFAAEVCLE